MVIESVGVLLPAMRAGDTLARICYATLRDAQLYREPVRRPNKIIERIAFALAA